MKQNILYPSRLVFSVLTIFCMIIIFRFSMENSDKSSETSGKITNTAVHAVIDNYDELPQKRQMSIMNKAEIIIRKSAHFSLYAMLGFMMSMAVGQRKLFSSASFGVIIFCFLYAFSDEIHQSFIPGRSCEFRDMMIDTSGALTGMLISMAAMLAVKTFFNKIKEKNCTNTEITAQNEI